MVGSNTIPPGNPAATSSNEPAEEVGSSTVPQLPIELIVKIWQHLNVQERVKVQQVSKGWLFNSKTNKSVWKDALHLREDQSVRPDACKDLEMLLRIGKWTKFKFSRLAFTLQVSTVEQVRACKRFFELLPRSDVEDLVISSEASAKLGEMLDVLQTREQARAQHSETQDDFLFDLDRRLVGWKIRCTSQFDALLNSILDCSKLRSLILEIDRKILYTFEQNTPISQCKLDILSIQSAPEIRSSVPDGHDVAICDMVEKARVIDLIDYTAIECGRMLLRILFAASTTLKFLTINIFTRASFQACERAGCGCPEELETTFINLPNLKHLWLSNKGGKESAMKLVCPNLDSLRLKSLDDFEHFALIPSVKMLFIESEALSWNLAWILLTRLAADRLDTLYLYSDCMFEWDFFKLFQAETFPFLKKIVVLVSPDSLHRLKLDIFFNCSVEQLLKIRTIDTLIWQCAVDDELPNPSTHEYMHEHFTKNFQCFKKQISNDPIECSAEIMGNFISLKTGIEKMEYFQQFLQ
ncbi:uncharacterized protein FA14DRAFT_184146 [Meira miltonrushii]|uniref:F-box domain-containing protein n=1 Tax=Meira miltonrushii TaxID=1280837 RepID=A0A316VB24_9BASI|nr:uncharacterized protein FA14DRAFT_184146 [Meira miltonrushii]PWN34670.1 hypothetical protein FA14DRAFT_184146 [Meira miltonrushii]